MLVYAYIEICQKHAYNQEENLPKKINEIKIHVNYPNKVGMWYYTIIDENS